VELAMLFRCSPILAKRGTLLTRAAKQKGKRRKKEKPEHPPGWKGIETMAEDWGKWKHGTKIDVTSPWKDGEEPQWVLDLISKPNYGAIQKVADLDPYTQGLKFVSKRLRRDKIRGDNTLRLWREWSSVPSLKRTTRKAPPPTIAP